MEDKRIPILIGVIVVALLVIGGVAWRSFGGEGAPPPRQITAEEKANKEWLEQKIKETGGDFNKLAPADQRKMMDRYGSSAPFTMRQMAQQSSR